MSQADLDYAQIWQNTITTLDADGLPVRERAFLSLGRLAGLLDGTAVVKVPNDYTKDVLEQRIREAVTRALSDQLGAPVHLAVTVDPALDTVTEDTVGTGPGPATAYDGHSHQPQPAPPLTPPVSVPIPAAEPQRLPRAEVVATDESATRLNPKYTFDTFVIGASNRFAHAAAVAVAEAPAKAYTPLFVYGESGLGKTHLLHAIGHYARNLYPHVKVRYVNSEEFTNDFINSIRDDKAANFQKRYRDVDVLLIDDIQFLQGKVQTQEEFFHTFNTLHNANKQIVITSDRAPKRLEALED
ncbi:MAG TPA: DnaA/Hda family protein, partial [Pedococcus sp.]|nr:DnaA/Hda family protein [Pedococcus sp.]